MKQKELDKILASHKKWLNDDPDGKRADLRWADLRGADLLGADLLGANLQDANLRDANLRDANLQDADLHDADFEGANLTNTRFPSYIHQIMKIRRDQIMNKIHDFTDELITYNFTNKYIEFLESQHTELGTKDIEYIKNLKRFVLNLEKSLNIKFINLKWRNAIYKEIEK